MCALFSNPAYADTITFSLHDALPILIQYLKPPLSVGPSLKTCPKWLFASSERTSVRTIPNVLSTSSMISSSSKAFEKLGQRSEEHTSELQSRFDIVCRLLLEKKTNIHTAIITQR